jgi:hypothetical protein
MAGGMLWGVQDRDRSERRIAITGISQGRESRELLYTLETDEVSGIFALKDSGHGEQRLFHSSDCRVGNPCAGRGKDLVACSILHPQGIANLATMRANGSEFRMRAFLCHTGNAQESHSFVDVSKGGLCQTVACRCCQMLQRTKPYSDIRNN